MVGKPTQKHRIRSCVRFSPCHCRCMPASLALKLGCSSLVPRPPCLRGDRQVLLAACTAVHLYIALVACVVVLLQWLYFSANIGFAVHSHWYLGGLLHTHARLACMPSGSPLKYADDQGRTRAPRHTSSAGRQGGRFSSVERGVAPKGSRDSRRGATDGLAG